MSNTVSWLRAHDPKYERLYQAMVQHGEEDKFLEVIHRHGLGNKMARNEWGGGLNHTTRDYAITEAEKMYAALNKRPFDWTALTPFHHRKASELPESMAGYTSYITDILGEGDGAYFGHGGHAWTLADLEKSVKSQGQYGWALDLALGLFGTGPVDIGELVYWGGRLAVKGVKNLVPFLKKLAQVGGIKMKDLLEMAMSGRTSIRGILSSGTKYTSFEEWAKAIEVERAHGSARPLEDILKDTEIIGADGKYTTLENWGKELEAKQAELQKGLTPNEKLTMDLERQAENVKPSGDEWHPSAGPLDDIIDEGTRYQDYMMSSTQHTPETWPFRDPVSGVELHSYGVPKYSQADYQATLSYNKLATNMKNTVTNEVAGSVSYARAKIPLDLNSKGINNLILGETLPQRSSTKKSLYDGTKEATEFGKGGNKTKTPGIEEGIPTSKVDTTPNSTETGIPTGNTHTPNPNLQRTGVVHFLREGDHVNFLHGE